MSHTVPLLFLSHRCDFIDEVQVKCAFLLVFCSDSSCITAARVFSMATAGSSTGSVSVSTKTHESLFLFVRFSNLPKTTLNSREKRMINQRLERLYFRLLGNSKDLPPMCFIPLWEISWYIHLFKQLWINSFASHRRNLCRHLSKFKRDVILCFVIEMLRFSDQ